MVAENSLNLAANEAGESNEQEMAMHSISSISQSVDEVSSRESDEESNEISEDSRPIEYNSELEKAYASFKTKEKFIKAAINNWVKCTQSTM